MDKEEYRKEMQSQSMADHIQDVEEHLNRAAWLTRALWLAMSSTCLTTEDKRDQDALQELANVAAEQASAARYAWYLGQARA